MQDANPTTAKGAMDELRARRLVGLLQLAFLLIALFNFSAPFLSYHNERQNQTFDTAGHVFNEGWSAVLAPKTSFSLPGYEFRPFTVVRQEFPFHGVLGWPLVKLFGHPAAVVCLISISFALWSIRLMYLIMRQWLAGDMAAAGAALWAFSPLLLQFGQVPMPDILCTTGMLAAFWFALKNNLPASSGCFLLAVLAKISVIIFGLPILTALLVSRNCKGIPDHVRSAIYWGLIPLAGLVGWTLLELIDPDTPWTLAKILTGRGGIHLIFTAKFYGFIFIILMPYGLGLIGILGCAVAAVKNSAPQMNPAIKRTLVAANILYFLVVISKIQEPQYLLPSLAWLILMAAFGINYLAKKLNHDRRWRAGVISLICLQVVSVVVFASDLKAARVPDFPAVEKAAASLPPGARVLVAYPFYGASAAVWLHRNVMAVDDVTNLQAELPRLQKLGFTHLVLMDVITRTKSVTRESAAKMLLSFCHLGLHTGTGRDPSASHYALPSGPFCQFCDSRFTRIFSSDYIIVYALPPPDTVPPQNKAPR